MSFSLHKYKIKPSVLLACFTIISLVYTSDKVKAQDLEYSQFYASPLYINPAFSGFSYAPHLVLHYREQMPFFHRAFTSVSLSYDQAVYPLHGSLGLSLTADRAGHGVYNWYNAQLSYAYQLVLPKNVLKIGLYAGGFMRTIQWNSLTFDDMVSLPVGIPNNAITTETTPSSTKFIRPDFGFGLLFYNKNLFVGGSAKHLTEPYESVYGSEARVKRKFTGQIGYEIVFDRYEKIKLTPNVLATFQDPFIQINAGTHLDIYNFGIGMYARYAMENIDAAIFALRYRKDIFTIGYSYDLGLARFSDFKYGSHELSIAVQISESEIGKRNRRMMSNTRCPSFIR